MLGKLMKYEWKATGKILVLLNLYIVLLTVASQILMAANAFNSKNGNLQFVVGMLQIGYVISIIAVAIAVWLFLIFRFYKNLYTDEGYLMHTLPVKTWQLILSKLLYAFLFLLLTTINIGGSIFCVLTTGMEMENISVVLPQLEKDVEQVFHMSLTGAVLFFGIATLLSVFRSILMFYASISLGQLLKNHRIIGAILFYGGLYTVTQVIATIFMLTTGFATLEQNSMSAVNDYVRMILTFSYVDTILAIILYWVITQYMAGRKLNLE